MTAMPNTFDTILNRLHTRVQDVEKRVNERRAHARYNELADRIITGLPGMVERGDITDGDAVLALIAHDNAGVYDDDIAALRRIGLFVAELDEMKRMLRLAYPENYAKMDEYRELDEKKGPD